MSIDRRNLFYTRIEDLLKAELGIPEDLLHETLKPLFDQVAISVWSLGDIFLHAKRMGWPMSFSAGLEILSRIENRDKPGENGITWDTLFEAIDRWAQDMNWDSLSDDELEKLHGDMLIFCELEDGPNIETFHESISLLDAIRHANKILSHARKGKAVQIYCVDAEKAKQDIEIKLKGNLIRKLESAKGAVG